ncbi:nuclear transport factor 2 family protein [Streptomyces sp. NPDC049954]|uniref:nuclear transport factor 2 family protein n=1 Tax=Streptomyces sp. NPDC049954 TaxID=3155779 RepID=UPI00342DCDDD
MTQREDLASVMDRLALDSLLTACAVAVDDGDWPAYEALFAPSGRVDLRGAGGEEGPAGEVARRLAGALADRPVRQHLLVNRQFRLPPGPLVREPGDRATVEADYVGRLGASGPSSGGRCVFEAVRTDAGWLLERLTVRRKWPREASAPGR